MTASVTAVVVKAAALWHDFAGLAADHNVDASTLVALADEIEREAARRAIPGDMRDIFAGMLDSAINSLRPALAAARDREIDSGSRRAVISDAVDDAAERLTGTLRWLRSDTPLRAQTRKETIPMSNSNPWPLDLAEAVRKADDGHHVDALFRALQESERHPDLARVRAEIAGWRSADMSAALDREDKMRRQILLRIADMTDAQRLADALGLGSLGGAA